MSHNRRHIVANAIVTALDTPEVRSTLSVRKCALVDRLKTQTEYTDRDLRMLLRCTADTLFEDDED
jgi:hypothetical protein